MSMGHGEHDEWFFKYPAVYRFLRTVVNCDRFVKPVEEYLKPTKENKIIDVGCGVGEFSRIVPGHYEGYDLNERFIAYARKKFGSSRKHFYFKDVLQLKDGEKYDKGIVVNILHHFSDEELRVLLNKLKTLVKAYFVIVDADWDSANRFQRWLLNKDQGSYFRQREKLLQLLGEFFEIEKFSVFQSRSGSVSLFRCLAKPK